MADPKIAKIILWIAIGYALSPIDLIPDFIPEDVYAENYNKVFKK